MSDYEIENIKYYSQKEYNRVLDSYSSRPRKFSQTKCEDILIKHGASLQQAKNGAYVYLHHNGNVGGNLSGKKEEYNRLLNDFGAQDKSSKQCVQYLKSLGYSYGQSKTAVYNYRLDHGLIGKRP